jgi:uncharacterized damage-inducible protein DinB
MSGWHRILVSTQVTSSRLNHPCPATLIRVIDDFAKQYLHDDLRWVRQSLLAKLEGLSEYDVRRPLTKTGTNLLGLVKHVTLSEARYLGDIFDRPYPDQLPHFEDPDFRNRDHMWVAEKESRADIIDGYARACLRPRRRDDRHAPD